MAELTVDGLAELTAVATNDELGIWDVSVAQYKRITVANLAGGLITGGGVVATGGFTLTVPATGTAALLAGNQVFTGSIGIGATPTKKLQVEGTIFINSGMSDTVGIDVATENIKGPGGYWGLRTNTTGGVCVDVYNVGSPLEALKITQAGNLVVYGDMSALTITDRTPGYDGNALEELKPVKSKKGEIDHATLPAFARKQAIGADGMVEERRDLGAMISILTVAVQQLLARVEALEGAKGAKG